MSCSFIKMLKYKYIFFPIHKNHFILNIQQKQPSVLDEAQQTIDQTVKNKGSRSPKHNKKKSKAMPIRGRRIKTPLTGKGRFSVDVKHKYSPEKNSSAFNIEQNDMLRTLYIYIYIIICIKIENELVKGSY